MNEVLKMLNALTADELDSVIVRANIILEKKRREEAAVLLEKERQRQERLAQEKKRQQEIAELQRRLQELQNQKSDIPDEPVQGSGFVMYDTRRPANNNSAPTQAVPKKQQTPPMIACPHCHTMNTAASQYCENCGQKIVSKPAAPTSSTQQSKPAQAVCPHCHTSNDPGSAFCANCGQRIGAKPRTQPAPKAQPVQRSSAGVRYFGQSEKEWQLLPGEKSISMFRQDIQLVQPEPIPKMAYTMQVTNKRIVIEYIGSFAKNVGLVGGVAGELIRNAGGKGYKPWVEIPMDAITRYGVNDKNQFVIEAGETFVFSNKGYVKKLTDVIAQAKAGGR